MQLISTRTDCAGISASAATLSGIAPDGGLYVPKMFPDLGALDKIAEFSYSKLCAHVLGLFYDDISGLEKITKEAYAGFGDVKTAPVVKTAPGEYMLELWHGPTLAFKDMALSVLPRLMTAAKKDEGTILILVATSGDTGKAALEGFRDVPGTRIAVFYPDGGVSYMQRLQMVTQEGNNTHVMAVNGNFDDTQNTVKDIFTDKDFAALASAKGYSLSSANSINFGRLAPQIAYYAGAYAQLLSMKEITLGEKINFVVPTGNFGNILAAYYAKRMGLPIARLICASNKNNILTGFFNNGTYSLNRPFYKTMSPSMDILISSNLERLLFELTGRGFQAVGKMMKKLKDMGEYDIAPEAKKALKDDFFADWCGEDETAASIRKTFNEKNYLLDTHTAVAMGVYEKYKAGGDGTKTVIVSTASPYKFPRDVLASLGEDARGISDFDAARRLSGITKTALPKQILELEGKPVRHTGIYGKDELKQAVLSVL
ncbi:MAG: threonine synthase [Christensenellales bacterium]